MRGGIDPPGDRRFRRRVIGVVEMWKDFLSGVETLSPRARRDLSVGQRGNSRRRWLCEPQPISNQTVR